MTYILLAFCLLFSANINLKETEQFNDNYMSKNQTTAINGIFVFLVILSHASFYISLSNPSSLVYAHLRAFLGQSIVTTFLFYSGYGLMESIKKKGKQYVNQLPLKTLKLLVVFDIAVLLYLFLDLILKVNYPKKQIALAFTSWTNVGNSNWYITAILILYIIIFFAFLISRGNNFWGIILVTFFTVIIVLLLKYLGRPAYTYNTMVCLPAGMIFSYYRKYFDKLINTDLKYLFICLITFSILAYSRLSFKHGLKMVSIYMILFAFSFVLLTKKIEIKSPLLEFLGQHIFSIYILQRIPMYILQKMRINSHPVIFSILSIIVSFILGVFFDKYIVAFVDKAFIKIRRRRSL